MKRALTRLRELVENLPLGLSLAVAVVVGLVLPTGIAVWYHMASQQTELWQHLQQDHRRIVEKLTQSMRDPLRENRPEAGKPLLDAIMLDERVALIKVISPRQPQFLHASSPQLDGMRLSQRAAVMDGREVLGQVRVDMDTSQLEAQLADQWKRVLLTSLFPVVTALAMLLVWLWYKLLLPLQGLVDRSSAMAGELPDQHPVWHHQDELGVLGRRFQEQRLALETRIAQLEQSNRTLQDREAELLERASALQVILEAQPVPLVISALREDRLLYVSPGTEHLLGAPAADILAVPPSTLFADPATYRTLKAMPLVRGRVNVYECALNKVDGSGFTAAVVTKRIDYHGVDAAISGIIDLTLLKPAQRAQQNDALQQSDNLIALGSLLAGIAHELNNPLSVVVGRAIMLEGEATDAETKARLGKIRLAAERCARILKAFLVVAGQQPPQRKSVPLHALVTAVLERVGYGLHAAGIETVQELDPALPELAVDPEQMTQVFTHLIANAQQSLGERPPPRRLTIASQLDSTGQAAQITFTDNGTGVPEELRSRIFVPYNTSKPVGTGIGLSFSYGVVVAHGGSISLESPPEGGARFIVTLPLSTDPANH